PHPGPVVAAGNTLWIALTDAKTPVRDRPLLRLNLASGAVDQSISLGGQTSYLGRSGNRLFASVAHVGSNGSGPSVIVALDSRSGRILARRPISTTIGPLVEDAGHLWVLQIKPAALLDLNPRTLAPKGPSLPFRLSTGLAPSLIAADGYLWAAAPDAGE